MPVEFDEPIPESTRPAVSKKPSLLSGLLMKTGLVKTEQGAQVVYLIVAVLALAGAAYFFVSSTKVPPSPTPSQLVP